jgi:hypothetical protein
MLLDVEFYHRHAGVLNRRHTYQYSPACVFAYGGLRFLVRVTVLDAYLSIIRWFPFSIQGLVEAGCKKETQKGNRGNPKGSKYGEKETTIRCRMVMGVVQSPVNIAMRIRCNSQKGNRGFFCYIL